MDLKKDIIPVSELKTRMKAILKRVAQTGQPVLVTQNGHSTVFIVDVEVFQKQQNKLHLLEQIAQGEREILEGRGISHADVVKRAAAWHKEK